MIVCPACKKENEDFFMFCLSCGADLTATAAAAPTPPVAQQATADTNEYHSDRAERREARRGRQAIETREWDPDSVDLVPARLTDTVEPSPIADRTFVDNQPPPRCTACDAYVLPEQPFCPSCGARLGVHAEELSIPPVVGREMAGRLVVIREDGSDGDVYDLFKDQTIVGRTEGDISFPTDEFLGNKHAIFYYEGEALFVQPLDTTNGVFRRIEDQVELTSGDSFRIGQELLHFKAIADVTSDATTGPDAEGTLPLGSPLHQEIWGWLGQRVGFKRYASAYLLQEPEVFLGRERGEIIFPEDGYVSGSHAVVANVNKRYYLKDLGSSNGTYVRLRTATALEPDDLILSGQQLFRVEP